MAASSSDEDIWDYKSPKRRAARPRLTTTTRTASRKRAMNGDRSASRTDDDGRTGRSRAMPSSKLKGATNTSKPGTDVVVRPSQGEGKGLLEEQNSSGKVSKAIDDDNKIYTFCPTCQLPFRLLKVQTPTWHVEECLAACYKSDKECPKGLDCESTIIAHYKNFTHSILANARDGKHFIEMEETISNVKKIEALFNACKKPFDKAKESGHVSNHSGVKNHSKPQSSQSQKTPRKQHKPPSKKNIFSSQSPRNQRKPLSQGTHRKIVSSQSTPNKSRLASNSQQPLILSFFKPTQPSSNGKSSKAPEVSCQKLVESDDDELATNSGSSSEEHNSTIIIDGDILPCQAENSQQKSSHEINLTTEECNNVLFEDCADDPVVIWSPGAMSECSTVLYSSSSSGIPDNEEASQEDDADCSEEDIFSPIYKKTALSSVSRHCDDKSNSPRAKRQVFSSSEDDMFLLPVSQRTSFCKINNISSCSGSDDKITCDVLLSEDSDSSDIFGYSIVKKNDAEFTADYKASNSKDINGNEKVLLSLTTNRPTCSTVSRYDGEFKEVTSVVKKEIIDIEEMSSLATPLPKNLQPSNNFKEISTVKKEIHDIEVDIAAEKYICSQQLSKNFQTSNLEGVINSTVVKKEFDIEEDMQVVLLQHKSSNINDNSKENEDKINNLQSATNDGVIRKVEPLSYDNFITDDILSDSSTDFDIEEDKEVVMLQHKSSDINDDSKKNEDGTNNLASATDSCNNCIIDEILSDSSNEFFDCQETNSNSALNSFENADTNKDNYSSCQSTISSKTNSSSGSLYPHHNDSPGLFSRIASQVSLDKFIPFRNYFSNSKDVKLTYVKTEIEGSTTKILKRSSTDTQGPSGSIKFGRLQSNSGQSASDTSQAKNNRSKHNSWTRSTWSNANRLCPFYKKMPETPIAVDAFSYGTIPCIKAYFLSHFHADHYRGLTKHFKQPIYCSKETGNLVRSKICVAESFIRVLPMNKPCVVEGVQVTLLPANHCPGAVLFLFYLKSGKVYLHTGDFRADPTMEDYPSLKDCHVNTLYLDTTYCSPEYKFPTQQDAVQFGVDVARKHVEADERTLIVCGTYTIGKEKIFIAIAKALGCKVCITREKETILKCLEDAELNRYLTRYKHLTRLHVLPMSSITHTKLKEYMSQFSGKYNQVIGIKPTGWTYSNKKGAGLVYIKPSVSGSSSIYGIPYSEHSSYSEMERFVRFIKPDKIQPTVNVATDASRKKMNRIFDSWKKK